MTRLMRRAPLAAAQERRGDDLARGAVEIVAVDDDRRVLAPQLELHARRAAARPLRRYACRRLVDPVKLMP